MATESPEKALIVSRLNRTEVCAVCKTEMHDGDYAQFDQQLAHCLDCMGWGHLVFLPSGDPALTRRASKRSGIVVLAGAWNKRARRWERRGTLVGEEAYAEAQAECLLDTEKRERKQVHARAKAVVQDEAYREEFAKGIRALYPSMPPELEKLIALHACQKYSGRVGRTAAAKTFDEGMITLSVVAHVRHAYTAYDDLLGQGANKQDARDRIRDKVQRILEQWRQAV